MKLFSWVGRRRRIKEEEMRLFFKEKHANSFFQKITEILDRPSGYFSFEFFIRYQSFFGATDDAVRKAALNGLMRTSDIDILNGLTGKLVPKELLHDLSEDEKSALLLFKKEEGVYPVSRLIRESLGEISDIEEFARSSRIFEKQALFNKMLKEIGKTPCGVSLFPEELVADPSLLRMFILSTTNGEELSHYPSHPVYLSFRFQTDERHRVLEALPLDLYEKQRHRPLLYSDQYAHCPYTEREILKLSDEELLSSFIICRGWENPFLPNECNTNPIRTYRVFLLSLSEHQKRSRALQVSSIIVSSCFPLAYLQIKGIMRKHRRVYIISKKYAGFIT